MGYSRAEIFFLTGIYGLIGERSLTILPTYPLGFLLFAPLVIFVYGLIITPAMLCMPERPPRWRWLARYPLGVALPYLCAVPWVGLGAAAVAPGVLPASALHPVAEPHSLAPLPANRSGEWPGAASHDAAHPRARRDGAGMGGWE